ncbi:MAG: hypothetical protein V4501_12295 [Pseudomonadota bacterium]
MKGETVLYLGAGLLAFMIFSGFKSKSGGSFDLEGLDKYGADNVERLNLVYQELLTRGLSDLQIQLILSQLLHETGLFTNVPNLKNVDQLKNYAGITRNGSYVKYSNISDFVDDYLHVLDRGSYPLEATSVEDFNSRLVNNHYYTDNWLTYENALKKYFSLLETVKN